jgi:ribosomal protein S13
MEEGKSAVKHWQIPTWLTKVVGSSFVLVVAALLAVVGVASVGGYQLLKNQNEFKNTQEMMLANLRVINEQQVIRDIIEEKVGDKLSSDVKSRMSFELYSGCRKYDIRPELVMGLIEQESNWNPVAKNPSGATGFMQLMYDTAIKYYKARGITLTPESLLDPVLNIAIGIEILADKHEAAMIQGKTSKNDYMWALYYYCGKGDSYAREVMVRTVSYKKRLDTPLQEMLRKRQDVEETATEAKVEAEKDKKKK